MVFTKLRCYGDQRIMSRSPDYVVLCVLARLAKMSRRQVLGASTYNCMPSLGSKFLFVNASGPSSKWMVRYAISSSRSPYFNEVGGPAQARGSLSHESKKNPISNSFRIPHKPPAGSLKVLHAPACWGGIRCASQTKIYNLETDEFVSNPPF